jgi:hypothetical protein
LESQKFWSQYPLWWDKTKKRLKIDFHEETLQILFTFYCSARFYNFLWMDKNVLHNSYFFLLVYSILYMDMEIPDLECFEIILSCAKKNEMTLYSFWKQNFFALKYEICNGINFLFNCVVYECIQTISFGK